jgi:serine/threonine protein kinase
MKHWNDCELPDNALFPDNYKITEVIRESASSILLLAHDSIINNQVVIKCFKSEIKKTYLREINAVFDLQHPNLVRCLNTFHRTDGLACIVYEYLAGGSLTHLLDTQTPLPLQTIVACLRDILNALIYLNASNRIHCDIKPDNILLRPKAGGRVDYVLIDLGAACFLREAQEGRHVTGTPAYIAPERIKNKFFFNSDLYSLGVIAFEMCTGTRPFTGTVDEITRANLSDIPSLEAIKSTELRDFIDYLLEKNPHHRLETATLALQLLTKTMQLPQRSNNTASNNEQEPLDIKCFVINTHYLVALVYSHHIAIINPLKPSKQAIKTLLTSQPIQVLANDLFAYATCSRIQIINLNDFSQVTIKEKISDLKTWHINHNKLLWSNSYHCFYESLNENAAIRFEAANYLFKSEMTILSNGDFVLSEGMANNKIVFRDEQGALLQEIQLDDPIVALNHHNNEVLAISTNLTAHNTYSLWQLSKNQAAKKLVLAGLINKLQCINGSAFWINEDNQLQCCDSGLNLKTLNTFTDNIINFAVCYQHRFMAVYYKDDNQQPFITVLKIEPTL